MLLLLLLLLMMMMMMIVMDTIFLTCIGNKERIDICIGDDIKSAIKCTTCKIDISYD